MHLTAMHQENLPLPLTALFQVFCRKAGEQIPQRSIEARLSAQVDLGSLFQVARQRLPTFRAVLVLHLS